MHADYYDDKSDLDLGLKVHKALVAKGLETPVILNPRKPEKEVSSKNKVITLTKLFTQIWQTMGLDLTDDSLMDTPKRMAKMYVNELYYGLDYRNFPKCTTVANKMGYDEFVTVQNIKVMSACEHHGSTIDGSAVISYLPKKRVLGLSKFNRVTDFFSRRPQIQERLTAQIFTALQLILETDDIAIKIKADHFCVKARGTQDDSVTTTVKLGGVFKKSEARAEFLAAAYEKGR